MSTFRFAVAAVVLSLASLAAAAQDKVVYHVNDSAAQALAALRNVRNHLDVGPTAQITVVTLGQGVDFLMDGAKDRNGNPFDATVAALKGREPKKPLRAPVIKATAMTQTSVAGMRNFQPNAMNWS